MTVIDLSRTVPPPVAAAATPSIRVAQSGDGGAGCGVTVSIAVIPLFALALITAALAFPGWDLAEPSLFVGGGLLVVLATLVVYLVRRKTGPRR